MIFRLIMKVRCRLFGHDIKYSKWFIGERCCMACGEFIKED